MDHLYNPLKLSVYRSLFREKSVLILGGGAVGSHEAEYAVKMGFGRVDILDFDTFTLENAAKHSALVRTPEDVGRNKAQCVSDRLLPLLDEGGATNGIAADLCLIGPEAVAAYDFAVLCLDNFAAKMLFNELWLQIPRERRPIVIMDGTHDEMAQSVMLDGKEFCLRCLVDESWLETSAVRTSCSGPQVRRIDGEDAIVRTSNLASSLAAILSAEQLRAAVLGAPDAMNRRLTYTAYPHLELSAAHPMKKRGCPDCAIEPPHDIRFLSGSVLDVTLGEAFRAVAASLKTEAFELAVHRLNYKNIVYSGYIAEAVCPSCGKPVAVKKHEGRTFHSDLFCGECRAAKRPPQESTAHEEGRILRAFTPETCGDLLGETLFSLGYPLGAHLEVIERNGALDFLDEGKIRTTVFAFEGDAEKMHTVRSL